MAMIYSVYRGEHFLDVGTYKELCARWGWTQAYMRRMSTESSHRRLGDRALKIYRVCNEQNL